MSETRDLTGPLVRMIRETGTLALRLNSGKVKVRGAWMHLCPAGTPDILCFPQGRVCWIETKLGKYGLSPEQVEFQRRAGDLGHRYIVARSIDEGLEAVRGGRAA